MLKPRATVFLALSAVLAAVGTAHGADVTLMVRTTADNGPESLREVMTEAMSRADPVLIAFDIPPSDPGYDSQSGTWTFTPAGELPVITRSFVTLDGSTQTMARGDTNPLGPELVLSGSSYSLDAGFVIANAGHVTIRGFVIGEFLYGIQIFGAGSSDNVIVGNHLGASASGAETFPNYNGIELLSGAHSNRVGGLVPEDVNLVSGNLHTGIRITDSHANVILGNLVGVDREGTTALENCDGISVEGSSHDNVVGGPKPGARNIASGNWAYGIDVFGAGATRNLIQGNYIGTDISGSLAIPNTYGVLFDDRSYDNTVGGRGPGESNLISGNTAFGAYIYNNGTHDNRFIGNTIGLGADGRGAVPNETGVWIDGGAYDNLIDGNIISGNLVHGVTLFAGMSDRNLITGNRIGVDTLGAAAGNGLDGVRITQGPRENVVGGPGEQGNTIAHNGRNGVSVESDDADRNRISQNSIFANAEMGIDLFPPGPTVNDAGDVDQGPNQNMNTPVVEGVEHLGGTATVSGSLDTPRPHSASVELFVADTAADAFAQGRTFLGAVTPDASGNWTWTGAGLGAGDRVTATASDGSGNTSEFCPAAGGATVAPTLEGRVPVRSFSPRADHGPAAGPSPMMTWSRPNSSPRVRVEDFLFPREQELRSDRAAFVVTHTGAGGQGSLTEALIAANLNPGPDTIAFQLPVGDPGFDPTQGVWVFDLGSPLPLLEGGGTFVDGASQTAYAGDTNPAGPEIVLRAAGAVEQGLAAVSAGNTVQGLVVQGFTYGIVVYGEDATDNLVAGCFLGTAADGASAAANGYGLLITEGATETRVVGNVISGNASGGIFAFDGGGHEFEGNLVGTDPSGTQAVANGAGIVLQNSSANTVGGTGAGEGNLLSGNLDSALILVGRGSTGNQVLGNAFGVDITGFLGLPNDKGIVIKTKANDNVIGGSGPGEGNVISGNVQIGVYIEASDGNRIEGNLIGTNSAGTTGITLDGIPLQGNGVEFNTCASGNVLGGEAPGARNVVSGNRVYGVVYYGNCSDNTTRNNLIGTDITGSHAVPNATGICFDCASHDSMVVDNVISGNLSYGLFFVTRGTRGNTVTGNRIGTDEAGTSAVPNEIGLVIATGASDNLVGGDSPGEANLISGNRRSGVMITNSHTTGNTLVGNLIGTDASGEAALGNAYGVMLATLPSGNTLSRNVISGNTLTGVLLYELATGNTLSDNLTGTDAAGTGDLGNGSSGVLVDEWAFGNLVGGAGAGNVIAFNGGGGVVLAARAGEGNEVAANRLFANDGLGIDIYPWGVTENDFGDVDGGPNRTMNFPEITAVCAGSTGAEVTGLLHTPGPELARVEVFSSDLDPLLHGEGRRLVGTAVPDALGRWSVAAPGVGPGDSLTATATDADGNTSEFSLNAMIGVAPCALFADGFESGGVGAWSGGSR